SLLIQTHGEYGLGLVDGLAREAVQQGGREEKERAAYHHRAALPEYVDRLREGEVIALPPLPTPPGAALWLASQLPPGAPFSRWGHRAPTSDRLQGLCRAARAPWAPARRSFPRAPRAPPRNAPARPGHPR